MSEIRGTFTVKFYTNVDMTEQAFLTELDSCMDFTTVSHYDILGD
jgi:hypothetical protein